MHYLRWSFSRNLTASFSENRSRLDIAVATHRSFPGVFELPAASPVAIGSLDAAIVVLYLIATTLLGIWLGRGQKNNRDYFLAGHKLPTWALLLSIVATETSTVTFLSVPGKTYVNGGNFTFLQLA